MNAEEVLQFLDSSWESDIEEDSDFRLAHDTDCSDTEDCNVTLTGL